MEKDSCNPGMEFRASRETGRNVIELIELYHGTDYQSVSDGKRDGIEGRVGMVVHNITSKVHPKGSLELRGYRTYEYMSVPRTIGAFSPSS